MIALVGGSFDPPHEGHVAILRSLLALPSCEKIFLIPTPQNPLKAAASTDANNRLALLRACLADAGLADEPRLELLLWELERPGPSFTIETVERLARERQVQFPTLVLGTDAFATVPAWHRACELLPLVHFLIVPRPGSAPVDPVRIFEACQLPLPKKAPQIVSWTMPSVSSSELRFMLKNAKAQDRCPVGLQRAVWLIAKERRLYSVME